MVRPLILLGSGGWAFVSLIGKEVVHCVLLDQHHATDAPGLDMAVFQVRIHVPMITVVDIMSVESLQRQQRVSSVQSRLH